MSDPTMVTQNIGLTLNFTLVFSLRLTDASSVYNESLAGYERCHWRRQKKRRVGNILGLSPPA